MTHRPALILIGAGAACAALAGCTGSAPPAETASAGAAGGRQCFLASQVNGFHPVDRDTVDVRVNARDRYRLKLAGVCTDIDWSLRIGIKPTGGGSWVCRGLDAELLVPSPIGLQRCLVTDIRKLSDAEIEAERAKRRG